MLKKITCILLSMFLFTSSSYADVEVNSNSELLIDGKNYSKTNDGTYTFCSNVWHTRYAKSSVNLPFSEVWKTQLKAPTAYSQPVITEKYVIAAGSDCLYLLSSKDGSILSKIDNLQWGKTKGIYSSPLYISNDDGWYDDDNMPRAFIGTRNGMMLRFKIENDELVPEPKQDVLAQTGKYEYYNTFSDTNQADERTGVYSSPMLLFDSNPNCKYKGKRPVYIAFGDMKGTLHIINARTLNSILPNQEKYSFKGEITSSAISYGYNEIYSSIAIGVHGGHNKDDGFLFGGFVRDGLFQIDNYLNKNYFNQISDMKGVAPSTSIAEYKDLATGQNRYIFIFNDRFGVIYGYDEFEKKVVFKIDALKGADGLNTPTIVGNEYAVFTYRNGKNSNKAQIACINIKQAVEEAKYNSDKLANQSIEWVSDYSDFGGHALSGSIALNIAELKEDIDGMGIEYQYNTILIVSDMGTNPNIPNLKAYYVDLKEGKKPIKVQNAFVTEDKNGNKTTDYGIYLPKGNTELSFANGLLLVTDNKGVLHAYSYKKEQNISVVNFRNSRNIVEKGKKYTASADIINQTGQELKNVEVQYVINQKILHNTIIPVLPKDGITLNLDYTVPEDFADDTVQIELRVNMNENNRVIEESTYEDNTAYIEIPLTGEIDLEITDIKYNKYYPGIAGAVNIYVRNNSDKTLTDIPVKLTIAEDLVITEKINLLPNSTVVAPFRLTAPNETVNFTIEGHVNPYKNLKEVTYSNNKKKINASVEKFEPPTDCKNTASWKETRFSHYKYKKIQTTETVEKTDPITGKVTTEKVTTTKTIKEEVYVEKDFYSKLNASGSVSEDKIKSGYGIELEIESDISTNYDKKYKLTGAQRALAYFPDMNKPIELEPKNSISNLNNTWILPVNNNSVLNKREHFIPVSWQDGNYPIVVKVFDASSPGGKPCKIIKLNVTIKGNMYEDDVTGRKKE